MKKNKLIAVVLIFTMLFVGCGVQTSTNPDNSSSSNEPTEPSSGESTEPFKIGLVATITGSAALEGEQIKRGAEMAIKEINEIGGVAGRKFELYLEDGKNDPTESMNAAQLLLDNKEVHALIGAWGSSPTFAIMPLVEEYEVPLIVETATNPGITEAGNKWVFRIASNEVLNSSYLGESAVKNMGFTKVGFMAVNSDWGRGAVEQYIPVMEAAGAEIIEPEYHDASVVNFSASINKLKNAGANSVVITTSLQTSVLILKQLREANWYPNKLATSGYNINSLLKVAGEKEVLEDLNVLGYRVVMGFQDPDPEVVKRLEEFDANYHAIYNEGLERSVSLAYDAVYTLAEGLKNANGSVEPEELREGIAAVDFEGITGRLNFDEKGQARPVLYMTYIKDGEQKLHNFK